MARFLRFLALCACLLLTACARPFVVRAPVLYPARVPVRTYPELIVAGPALEEGDLAGRLATYLSADKQRTVRRAEVKELEPTREQGAISPFTLVVLVEPALFTETREEWDVVPVQICDFYWGCFIDYQSVYMRTPALIGQARLTVFEGPTARTLQTEVFEAITFARDTKEERARVLGELATQLEHAVDVLSTKQRLELLPVRNFPAVEQALTAIRAGDWAGGRALLEQASQALGGRSKREQARVWYNLGIVRWYSDPKGELTLSNYQSAARALKLAASLEPRFLSSVAALESARERQAVLDEQRRAAAQNRALYRAAVEARR